MRFPTYSKADNETKADKPQILHAELFGTKLAD